MLSSHHFAGSEHSWTRAPSCTSRNCTRKRGNEESHFLSLGLRKDYVEPVASLTSRILREGPQCGTGIGRLCGDMQQGAGSCSLKRDGSQICNLMLSVLSDFLGVGRGLEEALRFFVLQGLPSRGRTLAAASCLECSCTPAVPPRQPDALGCSLVL